MNTSEVQIVGAGAIGLALAHRLALGGRRVSVVEARHPGQASWAAAGILPPAVPHPGDPLARLVSHSLRLYPEWVAELRQTTGIDPEWRRCGAIYLARNENSAREIEALAAGWSEQGVDSRWIPPAEAAHYEPGLSADFAREASAALVADDEAQIRPPRLLAALTEACRLAGVEIVEGEVSELVIRGERVLAAATGEGRQLRADRFCICGGAWSSKFLESVGVACEILPVRGQILLLAGKPGLLRRIVNCGPHYLVPRDDGQVLVGSTVEYAGFAPTTTDSARNELRAFAQAACAGLAGAEEVTRWAGLRPGAAQPILGRVPHLENLFVAAGHFRSGWILAPATAESMAAVIEGQEPSSGMARFAPVGQRESIRG